jgi:hypothetical protein
MGRSRSQKLITRFTPRVAFADSIEVSRSLGQLRPPDADVRYAWQHGIILPNICRMINQWGFFADLVSRQMARLEVLRRMLG